MYCPSHIVHCIDIIVHSELKFQSNKTFGEHQCLPYSQRFRYLEATHCGKEEVKAFDVRQGTSKFKHWSVITPNMLFKMECQILTGWKVSNPHE